MSKKFVINGAVRNTQNARGRVRVQFQLVGKNGPIKGNKSESFTVEGATVTEVHQEVLSLLSPPEETKETKKDKAAAKAE